MEPTSTGTLLMSLGKLGAGAASGALKGIVNKRLLRLRVSFASARKAKKNDIVVGPKAIRDWLRRDDVQSQLESGTSADVEAAVRNLAWRLAGEDSKRQKDALTLLGIILDEYLRALMTSDATVLANRRTLSKIESKSEEIRSDLEDRTGLILQAMTLPDVFVDDLAKLHPWRRHEANELGRSWPEFRRYVHTLCSSESPSSVLGQWATNPPDTFSEAPAEAWCWFGVLASDYGEHEASHKFFTQGLAAGAVPSNYWWARTALNFAGEHGDPQRVRDVIARSELLHPLGSAVLLMLDNKYIAAETTLMQWQPNTANDHMLRKLLMSKCAELSEDPNRAISIALEACSKHPEASGPALRAAEMLLNRGLYGISDNPLADFAQAHTLAIRARDGRRSWRGDSVAAILVAIKACVLGNEPEQAWRYTQGPPDGAITPEEAGDLRLRRETAILAACMSNFDFALHVAEKINEPYITAWVGAFAAHGRGDNAAAESGWMKAWDLATDDFDRLQAANALAPLGMAMPDLSDIAAKHPHVIEKINTIHRVMSAPGDRITILRARAHEAEVLTVLLAEQLGAIGRHDEAAKALEAGAQRWNSPLLEKMAASRYLHAGDYPAAITATHAALSMAGPGWESELNILSIRLEALEAEGLYAESLVTVRRMIMIAPDNPSVRWALTHCLVRSGDADGAWAALTGTGEPIEPRNLQDARTWISLASAHDRSPRFVNRSLEIMRRFPEDPDFLGAVLGQIYFGLSTNESEINENDLQALHAATARFTEANPNSSVFRMITVGPDSNPLAALEPEFKDRHGSKEAAEIGRLIQNGELPLGMATEMTSRSYAELAIQRGSGLVYSQNPLRAEEARLSVAAAIGHLTAIDTTAAVSLALLDPQIADQLTGVFASIESTDAAFRDAQRAQQTLDMRSTLSANWNEQEQRIVASVITAETANKAAEMARRTVATLRAATRRNWSAPRHLADLGMSGAWLSTLDYAIDSDTPFWSDDLLLRLVALEYGVSSFGTLDVIGELVRTGRLSPDIGQVAEATLVANYHVDTGFKAEVMRLAAELTGWKGAGAAAALTRVNTWDSPPQVVEFLHEALSKVVRESPDSAQEWVRNAATGLINIVDHDLPASLNLQLLLKGMFPQPWMQPDTLPFVLKGIRNAAKDSELEIEDPLQEVLSLMHRKFLEEHEPAGAAELLLMWVRHLEVSDREMAARIILMDRPQSL
ncbi:tetratricopeptide repeat protein [Paenarthrobacter nicotinovorans]|uniref:tetratricopeptide repeat protein n=1 Tax=Paenarthrobacter nicotinovorans TaxID=29320 RepID=UPI003809D995